MFGNGRAGCRRQSDPSAGTAGIASATVPATALSRRHSAGCTTGSAWSAGAGTRTPPAQLTGRSAGRRLSATTGTRGASHPPSSRLPGVWGQSPRLRSASERLRLACPARVPGTMLGRGRGWSSKADTLTAAVSQREREPAPSRGSRRLFPGEHPRAGSDQIVIGSPRERGPVYSPRIGVRGADAGPVGGLRSVPYL